jgi:CBS domain-containing protein
MTQSIREVMTKDPVTLTKDSTIIEAARAMKKADAGPVLVTDDGDTLYGIVTDRDIVVRAVAEGQDPNSTKLSDIATRGLNTLSPDDSVEDAIRLMRDNDIRRIPIVEGDRPIGIVSIGDLAMERDEHSVLADISSEPPNN